MRHVQLSSADAFLVSAEHKASATACKDTADVFFEEMRCEEVVRYLQVPFPDTGALFIDWHTRGGGGGGLYKLWGGGLFVYQSVFVFHKEDPGGTENGLSGRM